MPAKAPADRSTAVAFVAGATGYTGRELVRVLVEQGVRTLAHVRPDSGSLPSWKTRFAELGAEVDTTPWDEAQMTARLEALAPTHVFALLGTTRRRAASEGRSANDAYDEVDYGLSALLLRAVVGAELRPRFVYLSAEGVSEGTRNPYLRARVRVEAELLQSGIPYTIARPSFITGPDRDESRTGERVGAAFADGVLAMAGALGARKLRDRYKSTTAGALAQGLVRVAFDDAFEDAIARSEALR